MLPRLLALFVLIDLTQVLATAQPLDAPDRDARPNIIFILSDDHRYDAMGFMGRFAGLETPALDEMARDGRHLANAFVSTALCSPSRASILTGLYAHEHRVVDNSSPADTTLRFFPALLQDAGYRTGFFGKWHMGEEHAEPRPGFDRWVSFRGQGTYYKVTLNIDGREVPQSDTTYTTDLLTRLALVWSQDSSAQPYFAYLSHKAVHAEFQPAKRHAGTYARLPISYPPTMWPPSPQDLTDTRGLWGQTPVTCPPTSPKVLAQAAAIGYDYDKLPMWVKRQRHSWHGVDYMYNGSIGFDSFYVAYLETLRAIDESVRDVLAFAKTENAAGRQTIVIYMGDNGFSFGEHGLIDKRHAYEESMRVPLMVWGPGLVTPGRSEELVQNVDIAPTVLMLAGVAAPANYRGRSMLPLLRGDSVEDWRQTVAYEYYWERAFPQTPTVHAVRSDRYKYIRYHGVWDRNEFYDLKLDPHEAKNLIDSPAHQDTIAAFAKTLWTWLAETDGALMPLKPTPNPQVKMDWLGAGEH